MSNENGSAEVISDQEYAQGSTAAVRTSADELMEEMRDVGRRLPPCAVKDLLSSGVCVRCIFRLFGIRGRIYSYSFLSPLNLVLALGEPTDSDKYSVRENKDSGSFHAFEDSESEAAICCICLGILQFTYRDDKEILVKRDSALDLAGLIADAVKQEGCLFDKFSLEVSVPPVILENDHAAWLYLKRKYESVHWIQEKLLSERISAKEALKFSLLGPLKTLLDVQPGLSSFHIRLTFSPFKASKGAQSLTENIDGCKRQRLGTGEAFSSCVDYADISTKEADEIIEWSLEESQTWEFLPEKVNEPCCFSFSCCRTPIIFGGRYLKYSRNVSQTRWIIDDERMGEASVEEIIGGSILPMCRADNYKFHAAGREDIDVRMLGSGRPFLVEIQNARHFPSEMSIKEIEAQINNSEIKLVRVKNLKVLGSQGWTLMREGEAEKQKQYAALVWISRSLEDADMQTVSSLKDMPILQRTPIRVLHRRSPLEREKTIHWMKIERITGSSQYFLLHLSTQAGTYIKEFVHGDLGRTHPSIGSILGCRAEILQLDVTDVKMDCFLTD